MRSSGVFAGVLDVDRCSNDLFEHDFSGEAAVATGSAGGDDDGSGDGKVFADGLPCVCPELVSIAIVREYASQGIGLLENLLQHGVRVVGHPYIFLAGSGAVKEIFASKRLR